MTNEYQTAAVTRRGERYAVETRCAHPKHPYVMVFSYGPLPTQEDAERAIDTLLGLHEAIYHAPESRDYEVRSMRETVAEGTS